MKKQVTIAEAKNHLPRIVYKVERGQPIEITRRGRPVAVILSINDYARMGPSTTSFWNSLQSFLKHPDATAARGASGFVEGARDRGVGRRVKL